MRLQRVRAGGSRIGEECDGTLRERVAMATKQGGTAGISIYSLSLELLRKAKQLQDRLFCITKL